MEKPTSKYNGIRLELTIFRMNRINILQIITWLSTELEIMFPKTFKAGFISLGKVLDEARVKFGTTPFPTTRSITDSFPLLVK
jgi:hypothetical protein